ncbi:papain-like cysteine peptidase [Bacillus cereus group sp. MYBK59-1]|uniref:Papain-like cysteine peptidase n=1 Tax=Bacillus cereus TaxID=1396 RepID=A0AAW7NHE1_BACCE|nr:MULTISPECIES: papain-like cysteine peptidase [Bacillus cereus group]MCB5896898.1 papain-like cysteine peptidase [Bacillus cereus]MCJ0848779.1 papain-like cysteine peptidase [Bacillus cereus]MDA2049222.1 papain-like cysteine peptidase [Bacillus cereus]MDA2432005.1 papain-like cysteine peptidase [Bacillus cereus]MDN4874946.1 papain-like cysteine peptidase [Bacillus cereus]
MNLEDIQKSYGVIVSLGGLCQVTNQIKRHNLRTFSGPLDWFYYPSLSDVNRLLQNRFKKFMKLENMVIEGSESYGLIESEFDNQIKWAERITYCIKDTYYNCFSMHDFPINSEKDLKSTYPSFKAKLDTRINRFLEKINSSESILFIRIWGNRDEAVELQNVLSKITNKDFNILICNFKEGISNIVEQNWGISRVCSIELPRYQDRWEGDDSDWDVILNKITLT